MWQEPNCDMDLEVYKDWLYEFNNSNDLAGIDFCATLSSDSLHRNYCTDDFNAIGYREYVRPNTFTVPFITRHTTVGSGWFAYDPIIWAEPTWYGDDGMGINGRGCGAW